MDVYQAILSRRSIRQFRKNSVSDQLCTKLLKAAMQAPSAHNTQPWHFIVIDKREIMNEIINFHRWAKMLDHAPLAIAVCGDRTLENSTEYMALNCAAATQNILLTAHGIGLGAVWLGIYPRNERMEKLSKILKLPQSIIPISIVAIGHPAEIKSQELRYREDRVHKNGWERKS
jgi:nitroreductase